MRPADGTVTDSTDAQNDYGEPNTTPEAVLTGNGDRQHWALVRRLSGRELRAAEETYGEVNVEVWLRYRPDLNETMWFEYRDWKLHKFNIEAILPVGNDPEDGRLVWLRCLCQEES